MKGLATKGLSPNFKICIFMSKAYMRHQTSLTCEKLRIPTLRHNLGLNEVSSNVVNLGS